MSKESRKPRNRRARRKQPTFGDPRLERLWKCATGQCETCGHGWETMAKLLGNAK